MKVIPATTIRLPSKGLFYDNGELDPSVVNGEIVIYPMTTLDEIIIRTPDMLLQGTAVEQVLEHCCHQIKKPKAMFSKDVDYILVMLRSISYGDKTQIPFTCPSCIENAADGEKVPAHEYPISMSHFIKTSKEIEEDSIKKNYVLELSNSMVIHLRPSTFAEMIKMYQIEDDKKTPEELQDIIMSSLLAVIKDVDGISDRDSIQGWLKILPVQYMAEIINKIADANNYGPTFSYHIKCVDCHKEHDISYILNPVSFFTLPSSLKTNQNSIG